MPLLVDFSRHTDLENLQHLTTKACPRRSSICFTASFKPPSTTKFLNASKELVMSSLTRTISSALSATTQVALDVLWKTLPGRQQKAAWDGLRQKLPRDLDTWRMPGDSTEAEEQIWIDLDPVLREAGFTPFIHAFSSVLVTPKRSFPLSSGYGYAIPSRIEGSDVGQIGTAGRLRRFDYTNPLCRAVRTRDGHDVIMRVITLGDEGHDHLEILRKCATGETSLFTTNHTLPMLAEFHFEDIIFGIFPKVGGTVRQAYGSWPQNSVGDVVEMLMQMLEALAFIHELNIAHRDAFCDNFVVQWHPESLLTMEISPSRPRVYMIDFEVAVEFPPESPADQRVSLGFPTGGSFSQPEMYARPHAPEFVSDKPYCPFKLDVWQLGTSFSDFKTTVTAIDDVLMDMTGIDPVSRVDAKGALRRMRNVVNSISPESLLIKPVLTLSDDDC